MSTGQDHVIKCSFCTKTQKQVKKLIAGPGVYICDECIVLCNDIIDEDAKAAGADSPAVAAEPEPRESELLRRLPRFTEMEAQAAKTIGSMVRELRELGVTWDQIGAALDLDPAVAQSRFESPE